VTAHTAVSLAKPSGLGAVHVHVHIRAPVPELEMWLAPTTTVGPETAAEMPKSLESAVIEPRVTKAQPRGPRSMVSSPPPAVRR
jgi:hypothetical protein